MLEPFVQVMHLHSDQPALIVEKSIRILAARAIQGQSHSRRVNATSHRLSPSILTFGFLSHAAP
jgi:hypothetical protein